MRFRRIAAMPLAFIADAATLGNIGAERSFTQQLFDAEARERRSEQELAAAVAVVRAFAEASASTGGGREP